MRKVYTPTTRKVYSTQATPSPQGTTVRRLHNNSLLSSPHTTTMDSSPRILKQTTISRPVNVTASNNIYTLPQSTVVSLTSSSQPMKCYVCDSVCGAAGTRLMDTCTSSSQTKLPNKIGRVIGDAFLVIVRADDVVCKRCVSLFNQFDQAETTMDLVKTQLMGFICKKYAIDGDDVKAPAAKLQKLNSGLGVDASPPTTISSTTNTTVVRIQTGSNNSTAVPSSPNAATRKVQVKVYKCMSCEFTTNDLKQFTPHYAVCPGVVAENNSQQQQQQQQPGSQNCSTSSTLTATSQTSVANHSGSSAGSPSQSTVSPASKVLARRPVTQTLQQAKAAVDPVVVHSCTLCPFKHRDKATYDEHMRRHIKVKPFKCRICSARFETRETASKHARAHQTEYYKCGTCSIAYRDREQLIKHFEVHRNDGTGGQQIIIKGSGAAQKAATATAAGAATGQAASGASTQKLLQETIDEACSDAAAEVDAKNIHFFSCSICSLTFIQENYYNQHMETHKRETNTAAATATNTTSKKFSQKAPNQVSIAAASTPVSKQMTRNQKTTNGQSLIKTEVSDDLESIFEKMHSDKSGAAGQQGNESSSGIDMPALGEEAAEDDEGAAGGQPVSMPSLDDDGETAAETAANTSAEGGEPMEIEDMHNSVEGGEQLKFIVNENGQLLQLDNHILTDAEGNQIIVQGADSEHFQQLLQSVAGLEGGTIQMIQGDNNQMILVQQGDNEPQLIDASMLNADGQIVIQQQGQGGEDGHSQSSEDAAAAGGAAATEEQHGEEEEEGQQQVQYNDAAHQEAVAVLAAAAEQHVLQAAAAAGAVADEGDLGAEEGQGDGGGAATEEDEGVAVGEEEVGQQQEQPQDEAMQSDDNSQAASEAVSVVGGEGGVVANEGVTSADDASQEAEGGDEKMEEEPVREGNGVEVEQEEGGENSQEAETVAATEGATGEDESVTTTTGEEEKISSTSEGKETEANPQGADYQFFE